MRPIRDIGKKVIQRFMVKTSFVIDEYTSEARVHASEIKRELSRFIEDVQVKEVKRLRDAKPPAA